MAFVQTQAITTCYLPTSEPKVMFVDVMVLDQGSQVAVTLSLTLTDLFSCPNPTK